MDVSVESYHKQPDIDVTDIGTIKRASITDVLRTKILNDHFKPHKAFSFPPRTNKSKKLSFRHTWLEQFSWLVYSKSLNGGFCLPCFLFAVRISDRGCQFGCLVDSPFVNFKKALGKDGILFNHEQNDYHKAALMRQIEFSAQQQKPMGRVDVVINKSHKVAFEKNKLALTSIVECILYCGKQGLAFRGHRDDGTAENDINKGNYQSLIEFRSQTDNVLLQFLNSCPKNAKYTSKTIQNEVIDIIGEVIQKEITKNITEFSPFYGIIGDEVTDSTANTEIFSLCIRYLKYFNGIPTISEGFLHFTALERTTSDSILKALLSSLSVCTLNKSFVRGQAYDTTSSMSSEMNGVQGKFRSEVSNALYSPCNSHKLNLVIASACKLNQIKNCIAVVNEAHLFFKMSPKRQRLLEKMISLIKENNDNTVKKIMDLCKTRWVERFEAYENFVDMALVIVNTCEFIAYPHLYEDDKFEVLKKDDWNWDNETKSRAQGLLCNIRNFETLVAVVTMKNILEPLRGITTKLQKRDLDILEAYNDIDQIIKDVKALRTNIDGTDNLWYSEIMNIAEELQVKPKIPRTASRQTNRANHPSETIKEYYKRSILIPFIDYVSAQLTTRFDEDTRKTITSLLRLVPKQIAILPSENIPSITYSLMNYDNDLPRIKSLNNELTTWRNR